MPTTITISELNSTGDNTSPGAQVNCNASFCYINSLPGILNPSDNSDTSGGTTGVVSDINEAGISVPIKDTIAYAEPNGDINIKIDGPYLASSDTVTEYTFKVFISKENAREKYVVYENTNLGSVYTDDSSTTGTDSGEDTSEGTTPTTGVIFSELDPQNTSMVYYYLKIKGSELLLARGTYVVRIYKESSPGNGDFKAFKAFTLTVRTDPIQGKAINKRYLNTQNRYGIGPNLYMA